MPKITDKNKKEIKKFSFSTKTLNETLEKINQDIPIKMHEKPWFKNIPGVRKPYIKWNWTEEEQYEYYKCKTDIFYFAEKYCKIKSEDGKIKNIRLRDYQESVLDLFSGNRAILMASRQTGKTICAAITLLHYITFNNDKGCMVVANKASTVIEIIDKIKNIYKLLPYFLKVGVINWTNRSLSFENGTRIKTEARTKEPSIGFTIDFLYLDEFAHIPRNIIEAYYRSVVPTVSSISNSKIIITSTPNGPNLFQKLWIGANLPKGAEGKNPYKPLKVMWYQVPGRLDTKVYLNDIDMEKYGYDKNKFELYLKENDIKYDIREEEDDEGMTNEFFALKHIEGKTLDDYKTLKIGDMFLSKMSRITNWEEQETLLIGSKEAFDQEYNLHFMVGSKRMFEPEVMMNIQKDKTDYEYKEFKELTDKLGFEYNEFLFSKLQEDFDINLLKNYHGIHTIDISEGVGGDSSVINNFKCVLKTKDEIDRIINPKGLHDYFKLRQIGRYCYNKISVQELALIYYIWAFEILDPYKWKTIVEANMFGGEFVNALPGVFNKQNKFGTYIMSRFKHKVDSNDYKIGIKVGHNKTMLIKNFQTAVKKDNLQLTDPDTFEELNTFVKHEKQGGHVSYSAEAGHDDIIMTCIHAAQFLETQDWKIMCEQVFSTLDKVTQDYILDKMKLGTIDLYSTSSILKNAKNYNGVRNNKIYTGRFKKMM